MTTRKQQPHPAGVILYTLVLMFILWVVFMGVNLLIEGFKR